MRFLSKIILIKSASFDFQELLLDGNVHFTGDQGTGKSTIQRAILFFYNADSQNLGIKQKQDSFADFYLPNTNSHIIYEVSTETTKFSIWLHKESNHVCYRFISTPYNQEFFVENTTKGFVSRNPEDVLAELRKYNIRVHRQVSKFHEYRDIIYGNIENSKTMREFLPYSILKSPVYQNIPKTISSIFLNSELKSGDIKNTIIQSISHNDFQENEGKGYVISLQDLKKMLSDFRQDYHDINNYSKIQKRAEQIINIYNEIQKLEQDKIMTAQQLGSNYKTLQSRLEFSQQELAKLDFSFKEIEKVETENATIYKLNSDKIKETISIQRNNIETVEKKEKYYNEIQQFNFKGISKIIEFTNIESFLRKEQNAKQTELDILLTEYKSVEEKYKTLFEKLEIETQNFKNNTDTEKNKLIEFEFQQKELKNTRYEDWRTNFDKDFSLKQDELEKQKEFLIENYQKTTKKHDEINQTEFFKNDIYELQNEISENSKQSEKNENSILLKTKEIENLVKQSEFENKELANSFNSRKSEIERNRKKTEEGAKEISDKLQSFENSFYEYLNHKYENWQETIGRVCDENILFSQFLQPEIVNIDKLFYGVKINLEEIPIKVKTIEEYKQNLSDLNENLKNLAEQFEILVNENETNKVKIEKKYNDKVKPLNKDILTLKAENQQISVKNEKITLKIAELKEKAKKHKAEELAKIQPQITDLETKIKIVKNAISANKTNKDLEIQKRQENKKSEISQIEKTVKDDKLKLDNQLNEFVKNQNIQKQKYETDKENELTGKGANTDKISELQNLLGEIKGKLEQIADLNKIVTVYNSDFKEWINELPNFKTKKETAETNLIKLNEEFKIKKDEIKKQKDGILEKIKTEIDTEKNLNLQNDKYIEFSTKNENTIIYKEVEYFIVTSNADIDNSDIGNLIDHIKNIYINVNEKNKDLQEKVNKFLSPFKPENIFKFPINVSETVALHNFANNLNEFVAENKYAEYQKYFKELYARLINLIVSDIDRLTSKYKEIAEIVENKMNRDLDKRNFVSVVQKVELKVETSQNKIVQTFQEIKNFNDKNPFHFGETNLFTGMQLEESNDKALQLLTALLKNLEETNLPEISLKDTFELKFKVVENQKDTGWQEKLTDIGSEGTDILVKAMIYITLLFVFKEKVSKKFKDFHLHCIMDEIGRIHPKNIESLINYANERGIIMVNGSPVENNALAYKHVYDFKKTKDSKTIAVRLIKKI